MNTFNPIYETGGIKMRLTEICHGNGMAEYWRAGGKRAGKAAQAAYDAAYFKALTALCPAHPALKN